MNYAIIVAAGKSIRMRKNANKVFLPLLDKPMLYYSIKAFEECNIIDNIVIVTQEENIDKVNEIRDKYNFKKIKNVVIGGKERQDSVYNGLMSIKAGENDIIIVHNGSNPLVKENEIVECIQSAEKHGAAAVGFPVKDTLKKINNGIIVNTIDRSNLWHMQTPQAVRYLLFLKAFENANLNDKIYTDEMALVETIGVKGGIVKCSNGNIKITTPEDLAIAEGILMGKNNNVNNTGNNNISDNININRNIDFRTGIGLDSHEFSENKDKPLVLGGYTVSNETGLKADSDGDVVLHAIFNAISQSIGDKSLGYYATPLFKKGIKDSREYLKIILEKLSSSGYIINNIGITIEAKKPILEPHSDSIKKSLSQIIGIGKEQIGINFTTGDNLTMFSQGAGIQCFTVVTTVASKKSSFG